MSARGRSRLMNHIIAARIADLIMPLSIFILFIVYVYILIVMFTDSSSSMHPQIPGTEN
jgi:hypothetical protein